MKTKICQLCKQQKPIWGNINGKHYCKYCYLKIKGTKPISSMSNKQKLRMDDYMKVRNQFLNNHPICQANLPGCTHIATQIHHKAGRIGTNLTDSTNFLAVCFNCHRLIEENPELAKSLNLSKSRLDET